MGWGVGGENKQVLNVQHTDSRTRTCQTTTNKNRSGGGEKNVSLQYYGSLTLQELQTALSRKWDRMGQQGGKKNYKRLSQTQTLHHYFFPRAIYKANAIQAKARRPPYAWMNCGGSKLSRPLPHRWKIWEGKKKKEKKMTKGWLSRCTGGNNNNKQLCEGKKESQHCVAEKVKCSHHNGHAKKKKISHDRSKLENNEILQYFFSPHSSCAFNNKKKTERETNFCTLYNYNVFVAWYIYNAMAAKVRRLNKNAARVLYTPVRTRTYEKHVCEGS